MSSAPDMADFIRAVGDPNKFSRGDGGECMVLEAILPAADGVEAADASAGATATAAAADEVWLELSLEVGPRSE